MNETTWIYTSERFAPPGAPVGLPKGDLPCEVAVRPGLSFVTEASYFFGDHDRPGLWFYEAKLYEPLPYIVYAWRPDRRTPAPISEAYEDLRQLLKVLPEPEPGTDPDYDAHKRRLAPENCFRALYPIKEKEAETTSTDRAKRYFSVPDEPSDTAAILQEIALTLANASKRYTRSAQRLKEYGMPETTGHVTDDAEAIMIWLLGLKEGGTT